RRDLRVGPEAEIDGRDASLGGGCCGLRHHEPCAPERARAQVNEVPARREPVDARVLAHRRDEDAVRDGQLPEREWRKQFAQQTASFSIGPFPLVPAPERTVALEPRRSRMRARAYSRPCCRRT